MCTTQAHLFWKQKPSPAPEERIQESACTGPPFCVFFVFARKPLGALPPFLNNPGSIFDPLLDPRQSAILWQEVKPFCGGRLVRRDASVRGAWSQLPISFKDLERTCCAVYYSTLCADVCPLGRNLRIFVILLLYDQLGEVLALGAEIAPPKQRRRGPAVSYHHRSEYPGSGRSLATACLRRICVMHGGYPVGTRREGEGGTETTQLRDETVIAFWCQYNICLSRVTRIGEAHVLARYSTRIPCRLCRGFLQQLESVCAL